jgi:hypothetical protein
MQIETFTPNTDAGQMVGTADFTDGKSYMIFRQHDGSLRFLTMATSKHGNDCNRLFKSAPRAAAVEKYLSAQNGK